MARSRSASSPRERAPLATGSVGLLGYPVLVAAAVAAGAHFALYHTRFGVHLLATGGQTESARAMGISTARIKIAARSRAAAPG